LLKDGFDLIFLPDVSGTVSLRVVQGKIDMISSDDFYIGSPNHDVELQRMFLKGESPFLPGIPPQRFPVWLFYPFGWQVRQVLGVSLLPKYPDLSVPVVWLSSA